MRSRTMWMTTEAQMAEHHVPGVAVAVINNGRVVKIKATASQALNSMCGHGSNAFEIGSVSKQMTAAAIMLLVEEARLTSTTRYQNICKHARHMEDGYDPSSAYTQLRVRATRARGFDLIKRMKVDDFIKKLAPEPLEFTPGEKNIYSNSGFSIIAYVIRAFPASIYGFYAERIFTWE